MTITAPAPTVTPGVYDIPADDYHADPIPGGSLSSSGARLLLSTCPAVFRHQQDHPPAPKREFDLGHAAHQLVLGAGPELRLVDYERWDTKEAKEKVAKARTEGAVPLKRADYDQVRAMATALRQHPVANALFNPERGTGEQALFWQDGPTGIWRRALLDWLPTPSTGRLIVPDYKTTRSASPDAIQKAVHAYGYHQQAAWYLDGIRDLGLGVDPAFVFVFQEKEAPYLVTVVELDAMALHIARDLNQRAIRLYRECVETDRWPGYADDIALITLPAWAENRFLQETS